MKKISLKKLFAALILGVLFSQVHAAELKVAAIQFTSRGKAENIAKLSEMAIEAAKNGAKLIVMPEETIDYLAFNRQMGLKIAETFPGDVSTKFGKIAEQYKVYIVYGYYEIDRDTNVLYNSAAIVGPNGYKGNYRKNQLANSGDPYEVTPGNLGTPVFDTPIGKISPIICYDDSQLQSLLLPALRGADILTHSVTSAHLLKTNPGSQLNHSTISAIATVPGWLGLNVISSDSTDAVALDRNTDFIAPGGSAIYDVDGKMKAAAAVTSWADRKAPQIIYSTIDLNKPNPQREYWLKHRRPELYSNYNTARLTHDHNARLKPMQIAAMVVQYEPKMGDVDHNYKAVDRLMSAQNQSANLVVLPFNSFIGNGTITKENVAKYAEPLNGKSYNLASNLAKKFAANLVFSMPESSNGKFYETAVLFDPQGKQVGIYRKSHLNDVEATWATAGNELPAFILDIGSVSIILNDEVRIPDLTNIHMLNRANMLVVPTAYNQKEYGGDVNIPKGLVPEEANKGMYIWYSMAKYSQAYTLVANYIKGEHGDVGQSALYSLVPEEGYYPPKIAPRDQEGAFVMNFGTNGNLDLWTNQQDKIHERRWDLALPLTLDQNSACFKEWKKNSASRDVCKAQY
jgi:predicted amidohydrolase